MTVVVVRWESETRFPATPTPHPPLITIPNTKTVTTNAKTRHSEWHLNFYVPSTRGIPTARRRATAAGERWQSCMISFFYTIRILMEYRDEYLRYYRRIIFDVFSPRRNVHSDEGRFLTTWLGDIHTENNDGQVQFLPFEKKKKSNGIGNP